MAREFICPVDFVHVLGHSPTSEGVCRPPPVFHNRGAMDVVQSYRGGSFRIRWDADATRSILGAAAVSPAVAGLEVGAQALEVGHKLLLGDKLLVGGVRDEVGSISVPRVERMPSLVENRRHPAGCRFRSYSS